MKIYHTNTYTCLIKGTLVYKQVLIYCVFILTLQSPRHSLCGITVSCIRWFWHEHDICLFILEIIPLYFATELGFETFYTLHIWISKFNQIISDYSSTVWIVDDLHTRAIYENYTSQIHNEYDSTKRLAILMFIFSK